MDSYLLLDGPWMEKKVKVQELKKEEKEGENEMKQEETPEEVKKQSARIYSDWVDLSVKSTRLQAVPQSPHRRCKYRLV